MKAKTLFLIFLIASGTVAAAEVFAETAPLVVVYADGGAVVQEVTVVLTNPRDNAALLVTSVEFHGQLPEERYFYHGIYGSIRKTGDDYEGVRPLPTKEERYEHSVMAQQLTIPVGSCFILPGQSVSWRRPMRVVFEGYKADVTWRELPVGKIADAVWFQSQPERDMRVLYEPMTDDRQMAYRNMAGGMNKAPYVIVEGEFEEGSATVDARCLDISGEALGPRQGFWKATEDGMDYLLWHMADDMTVVGDELLLVRHIEGEGRRERVPVPSIHPTVADYLYLSRSMKESAVPCILAVDEFSDIVAAEREKTEMYFNPGVNYLAPKTMKEVWKRALERNLPITVKSIDPNGLGRQNVLTVGVEVDEMGRRLPVKE